MLDPQKTMVLGGQIEEQASHEAEDLSRDYVELELGSDLLSRYKVIAKLGEGGMGVVYSGADMQLNTPVAIKLLKRNVSQDTKAVEKLKEEAQVSMILTHPGIMRLINFEHSGEYAFLLMEYIDGKDLMTMARKRKDRKLDEKTIGQITYKVCASLDYAHSQNVIHRDIKPANIMISNKKEVKLMDFGIAKVLVSESTEHPQIAGTLAYIPPEIFAGEKPDPRCDIYALGVTMYELVSGDVPFRSNKVTELINMHAGMTPPPLPGVDKTLANIIFKCMEKKPELRYQSALELRASVGKFLGLDEGEKVSKMKSNVEFNKRQLEIKHRKMQAKMDQLESERAELQEMKRKSASNASPAMAPADYFAKDSMAAGIPVTLLAVAAVAGLVAAFIGKAITEGQIIEFGSLATAETLSMVLAGAIIVGAPAALRQGTSVAVQAAVIGAAAGFAGYLAASWANDYFLQNDIWIPYSLVTYLALGIFLAIGAAGSLHADKDTKSLVKIGVMAAGMAALTGLLPYAEIAESAFGFDSENSVLFYIPMASIVIWLSVDFFESKI